MHFHFSKVKIRLYIPLIAIISTFFTGKAFAHEVYVLDKGTIAKDLNVHDVNVFSTLQNINNLILFTAFIITGIIVFFVTYKIGRTKRAIALTSTIEKARPLASLFIRAILGISLIYSSINSALFGPEIRLEDIADMKVLQVILLVSGVAFIVGMFTRFFSLVMLFVFALSVFAFGIYQVTYINYLGELLVLLVLGGESLSIDRFLFKRKSKSVILLESFGHKYADTILRVTFGISLIYAAIYVKFLHPELSIDVIRSYNLQRVFPFDPSFTVLAAGCVESIIGILFIVGFSLRWNIIFFIGFVTASLLFFGESVWPHFILYGIAIAIFIYGYDKYTLQNQLKMRSKLIKSTH